MTEALTARLLVSRAVNLGANFKTKVSYSLHAVSQNAAAAREVGEYLWQKLAPHGVRYLLAPGSGAAPVAAAIGAAALRDNIVLETLYIRDASRARKDESLIEGHLPDGPVKAAFVDDVIMLGGTYRKALEAIAKVTDRIDCVAVALIFDSFHEQGSRSIAASGVPVYAVTDRREIGLTRDSLERVPRIFSPARWIKAGLVSKPQFPRKTVPLVTQSEVIVGLDNCTIASFGIEDGQERWKLVSPIRYGKGTSCELLLDDEGVLYSGNYAGILTASKDGRVLWQYALCLAIHSRPTLADGKLFQNVEDWIDGKPHGRLLCLDAKTGHLLWEVHHPHYGPTGVAVSGSIAVTANNAHEVVAVSFSGEVLWRHKQKALSRGRVLIHNTQVIYLDEGGELVRLDLQSGRELQRARFSTAANHAEPLLVDGVLVVTDSFCHLAGYNPDNFERLWINRLRGACQWRPAVHGLLLITQTTDGGLAATVAATGEKLWESMSPRWGTGPVGLSSTHAAVLSMDGRLTCHELEI